MFCQGDEVGFVGAPHSNLEVLTTSSIQSITIPRYNRTRSSPNKNCMYSGRYVRNDHIEMGSSSKEEEGRRGASYDFFRRRITHYSYVAMAAWFWLPFSGDVVTLYFARFSPGTNPINEAEITRDGILSVTVAHLGGSR